MTDDDIDTKTSLAINRLIKHLPEKGNQTEVILKGHLLIETLLRNFIDSEVRTKDALRPARLDFYQVWCIAKSLTKSPDSWVWNAIEKLNRIRNRLAHQLEPVGLEDMISDLVNRCPPHAIYLRDVERYGELAATIATVHIATMLLTTGFLDSIMDAID